MFLREGVICERTLVRVKRCPGHETSVLIGGSIEGRTCVFEGRGGGGTQKSLSNNI